VITWGLWGVCSKIAATYTKPRQALLFQTVGIVAFALLVLGIVAALIASVLLAE
jgi:hypothetical protein